MPESDNAVHCERELYAALLRNRSPNDYTSVTGGINVKLTAHLSRLE